MEVLYRIPIFHQGEVLSLVAGHLVVAEGEVCLPRLPTPSPGILQASELLIAPGQSLMDPDAVQCGTGGRQLLVVRQCRGEVPARLRLDGIEQVGHGCADLSLDASYPQISAHLP